MQKCEKLVKREMKMLHTRLRVSMFIVLALCQELASYKPVRISPLDKEIELEEGEVLSIQCIGKTLLKFVYPDSLENSINTSNCRIQYRMENGLYYYEFERPSVVFGDTGWYGCSNYNFDSSTNSNDMNLYVYVRSNTNLFVEADTNVRLSAAAGGGIVIPCRTTWRDLKPILIKGNGDELNEVPFDPKTGFTIRNLSLEDSKSYKCLIEEDGKKHAVSYALFVLKRALPEPKIQANDSFITRGQDLNVNCTVELELSMDCDFDWHTPQKSDRMRSIQRFRKPLDENTVLVTSQMMIFNVTDEDEGNYECIIKLIDDMKRIKKNIRIYDPRMKPIKFIHRFNTSYFEVKRGSSIEWRVDVDTLVEPYLQWFNSNGDEIVGNYKDITIHEKYDSNVTKSTRNMEMYSILKIMSLSEADSGNYVLQAKKDYIIEKINFTLDVIGEPIAKLTHFRSYYTLSENTEFHCEVTSNPPPKITWTFRKYPYYPFLENVTDIILTNVSRSADNSSSYRFETIVKMSIEMSGKIICEACNEVGCDSKTENIIVLDPIPPFFIKTNMNKTTTRTIDIIGEDHNMVILQCFADGMPKPAVSWYKDNMLLKENNQYSFKHNRQELHIRYFMLDDSGKYSCQAYNSIGINETYQQITVKDTKWSIFDSVLVTLVLILGSILIILAISFMIKIHRKKKIKKELMKDLVNFEEEFALECLNPNFTIDDQAELLPYDEKWEFPRGQLKLREQLSNGNFGVVIMKAKAIGIRKNENITTVAVKMVHRNTNPIYIRALVNELKILMHLGKHLNVINLFGACTKNILECELLVILEYCRFGNLHNFLLKHRNDFINQINPKTGKLDFTIGMDVLTRSVSVSTDSILCQPDGRSNYYDDYKDQSLKSICTQDLLSWAFQLARGMEYLSQRKVLHGDLAARNVLLTEDNVVKICDFGLAKNINKDGNYEIKNDTPVPVKWMAIESIKDRIFSMQSDVWSFGIVLWELFTLAETPYPDMGVEKYYQKLIKGYRMEQPDYATREVYNIMLQCWETEPTLRPSFTDLVNSIGNLLEESVRMHYITLNTICISTLT